VVKLLYIHRRELMDIVTAREKLRELQEKMYAYNYASSAIYVDSVTVAPTDSNEGRSRALGVLAEAGYNIFICDDTGELLKFLSGHMDELTDIERKEVFELSRDYERQRKIPVKDYVDYQVLLNDAQEVWHKAKAKSDFNMFAPYLEKIVDYNRRIAAIYDSSKPAYDVLLDQYERGADMKMLDKFFAELKSTVVPLLKRVSEAKAPESGFLDKHCPKAQQEKLSDYLMELMGLTKDHCVLGETEHPFTSEFNNKDVRITTHYFENAVASSMYSVIHEGGHALYELGVADDLQYTCLSSGTSMGIHESQSRFYENIIGRSRPFINAIFPKLCELFPEQLSGVTPDEFYRAVNKAEPSLIRTEADELTYSLHVMVRYEIEKGLIDGSLNVRDVPEKWNSLYKEYLGIDVPSDKEGCLQDSHWSGGGIGYFPSYSLGSAYGAQMLHFMERDVPDLWEKVGKGDLTPVTKWLREKIHRHGTMKEPNELMAQFGGFDPKYYTAYLTEKFSKIYGF
jgi:carboxypeptidase Taq